MLMAINEKRFRSFQDEAYSLIVLMAANSNWKSYSYQESTILGEKSKKLKNRLLHFYFKPM